MRDQTSNGLPGLRDDRRRGLSFGFNATSVRRAADYVWIGRGTSRGGQHRAISHDNLF